MTEIRIHWSFWIICVIGLIWNAMGCINFIMQMIPDALANFPDTAKLLVKTRPPWATLAFAIAVFAGVTGDMLLIFKKSIAYYLFIASILGVIVTNIHTFQVSVTSEILIGSFMSLVISAFFIWYARLVRRKGWVN